MMFLLGMRAIQAIGTSALYPAGIGIVRSYIQKNQNRVIATLSVFATTSAAFGPTISGLLIGYGGWSIIFYVNFPVILLSALLAFLYIPKDIKGETKPYKWDIIGIILFGSLMSSWMIFLQTYKNGVNSWVLVLSILLTGLFYFYEKRRQEPFINVLFLRQNPNISIIYVQYILTTIIFFAILLSIPTYLQKVLMLNSQSAGITMLSLSIFSMLITPIATRWTEKAGFRIPLLFGAIVGIFGVSVLITANYASPIYWLFIILAIIGISNGTLSISLQNRLYSFVPTAQSGIASGLLMTSRFIGNILASNLFGIIFASGVNDANKNMLTYMLLIVSVILIPGMLYITRHEKRS